MLQLRRRSWLKSGKRRRVARSLDRRATRTSSPMNDTLKERLYDRIEKQDADLETRERRIEELEASIARAQTDGQVSTTDALTELWKYKKALQDVMSVIRSVVNQPQRDRRDVQGDLLQILQATESKVTDI